MQGRSHSLSDHSAFRLALIAFACAVLALLSGSAPAQSAGTDSPALQLEHRVQQFKAPHLPAALVVRPVTLFAEDLPGELAELADPAEEDETNDDAANNYIRRSDLPAFGNPTGLDESPDHLAALTPFRLLAFSSCAPPSA